MGESPTISAAIKLIQLLTSMKKSDVFMVGFFFLFALSLGVLTGYIPSPLLAMRDQHESIIYAQKHFDESQDTIIELEKLQLYLARESCLHGARDTLEEARCDRESIRNAIMGTVEYTTVEDIVSSH
jgi:hypothetical protein